MPATKYSPLAAGRVRVFARFFLPLAALPPLAKTAGAAAVFCLSAAGITLSYATRHALFKQYDDAYITFRYAEKLATGHGLVFNVGDRTDSASSFLYTLLLALCHVLGMHDLPVVATVLGIFSAGATCAIVYVGCLERTRRPVLSASLSLMLGLHGLISGWAISGMETLFFSALVTLAVYRVFLRAQLGWFEAVLIATIDLTRFEGLILATTWFLLVLGRYPEASSSERRQHELQAAFVVATFAVFLIFKYQVYGTFLPHAFELKRITRLYAPKPRALWNVWADSALLLLLLAICGAFTLPRSRESRALILYAALSVISVVIGPYADWARYSVHLLPVAVLLCCMPLAILLRKFPFLALGCCTVIGFQAYNAFDGFRDANTRGAGHQACRLRIGEYLEQHLNPHDLVLSSDIGAIAYAAPDVSFIDAVGLTSSDVLEARARGESIDAILLARRPRVIADTCHGMCTKPSDFSSHGWLSNPGYWLTPLPRSTYDAHLGVGKLLEVCQSPDGLYFAATRFEP